MIHRKILKVKTIGSRATRDLRPAFSDETPTGINYTVHEYSDDDKTCIVEIWASDHEALQEKEKHTKAKWEKMTKHKDVVEVLEQHGKSPKVIGSIRGMIGRFKEAEPDTVTDMLTGKKLKFKRKAKEKKKASQATVEKEILVFDEG